MYELNPAHDPSNTYNFPPYLVKPVYKGLTETYQKSYNAHWSAYVCTPTYVNSIQAGDPSYTQAAHETAFPQCSSGTVNSISYNSQMDSDLNRYDSISYQNFLFYQMLSSLNGHAGAYLQDPMIGWFFSKPYLSTDPSYLVKGDLLSVLRTTLTDPNYDFTSPSAGLINVNGGGAYYYLDMNKTKDFMEYWLNRSRGAGDPVFVFSAQHTALLTSLNSLNTALTNSSGLIKTAADAITFKPSGYTVNIKTTPDEVSIASGNFAAH